MARLAIGIPVGSRFEVVAVANSRTPLQVGDTGTLLSVQEGSARLSVDMYGETEVDPHSVTLRPLLKQTA